MDILVKEIVDLLRQSRNRVAVLVNTELTLLYWQIGHHIKQTLLNDARAEYGKSIIKILSEKIDNYICLTIKDNGMGINIDLHKEKLFKLYSRFHFHVEGKGIGLHLVKTQIIALGGKIEVESKIRALIEIFSIMI